MLTGIPKLAAAFHFSGADAMTYTSIARPAPALDPAPLAVGLCLRVSPDVSQPDADGKRHRIIPFSFREDVGHKGRPVPLCDPAGYELGTVRVVEVAAGLRVEVFDDKLLKAITRNKMPMGLAAKWTAERSYVEAGVTITVAARLLSVALTDAPGFDACELYTVK
ncbi:MAG: hypothetical protein KF873_13015 [Gemmataceae bacterium]|nr:hypothetical protein [Gemmataceae bacterium]